jgi:hypothetical protein
VLFQLVVADILETQKTKREASAVYWKKVPTSQLWFILFILVYADLAIIEQLAKTPKGCDREASLVLWAVENAIPLTAFDSDIWKVRLAVCHGGVVTVVMVVCAAVKCCRTFCTSVVSVIAILKH